MRYERASIEREHRERVSIGSSSEIEGPYHVCSVRERESLERESESLEREKDRGAKSEERRAKSEERRAKSEERRAKSEGRSPLSLSPSLQQLPG